MGMVTNSPMKKSLMFKGPYCPPYKLPVCKQKLGFVPLTCLCLLLLDELPQLWKKERYSSTLNTRKKKPTSTSSYHAQCLKVQFK